MAHISSLISLKMITNLYCEQLAQKTKDAKITNKVSRHFKIHIFIMAGLLLSIKSFELVKS